MSNLEFITCNKRKYSFQAPQGRKYYSYSAGLASASLLSGFWRETVANLFSLVAHFDILPNGSLLKIKPLRIPILSSMDVLFCLEYKSSYSLFKTH